MSSISYPLRVPETLMEVVELRTKEEYVDKATALRQLVYMGAEDYVMCLYKKGRISLSLAAKLLGKSVHDVLRLALEKGIKTEHRDEHHKASEKAVRKLMKK